jgi:hypothetical protein
MPKAKSSAPPIQPEASTRSEDRQLQIILKEYDALRELHSQAEASAQSIFNFYLTLMTTVGGAIVLILQLSPPGDSQLLISGLLLFAASIGSVYLSSLTGRYAHMSRYAQGVDTLRRYLFETFDVPMPALYKPFLASPRKPATRLANRLAGWLLWLSPTGTYQLFVAAVNSLALAGAAWVFFLATGVVQSQIVRSALASGVIFLVTFVIYNAYSRVMMARLINGLGLRVDTSRELPFISGRQ